LNLELSQTKVACSSSDLAFLSELGLTQLFDRVVHVPAVTQSEATSVLLQTCCTSNVGDVWGEALLNYKHWEQGFGSKRPNVDHIDGVPLAQLLRASHMKNLQILSPERSDSP